MNKKATSNSPEAKLEKPLGQWFFFVHPCFSRANSLQNLHLCTLSQILQLYVAAYQAMGVWKEAWKHLCGVISVQIIRDVETFVSSNPFAAAEVMRFVTVAS